MSADHPPARPSWNCATCGRPWPCEPAQAWLAAGMTRATLVMHMASLRADAVIQSGRSPAEISDRFVGWIS